MLFSIPSLISSTGAAAQDPVESPHPMIDIRYVPEPTLRLEYDDSSVYCYDHVAFLELLDIDIELQDATQELLLLEEKISLVESNLRDTSLLNKLSIQQYALMKEDRDRVFGKWKKENQKRHVAEATTMWDDWRTYALVVAGAVALTEGVVIYAQVQGD